MKILKGTILFCFLLLPMVFLGADNSTVFAVEDTDGGDGGFEELITLMDGWGESFYSTAEREGLIGRNDVIILKVNGQWDQRGGTNTDLVAAVISALISHPEGFTGEIVVADNGQAQYGGKGYGGDLDWEENNARDRNQSIQDVVDRFASEHRVSSWLWDRITDTRVEEYSTGDREDGFVLLDIKDPDTGLIVSYPKFRTTYGTYISFREGIWNPRNRRYESDRLKVINMPVLKSHSIYYVTAAVKNYMGTTSDSLTRHIAHNTIGVGSMGTQMAETRMPVVTVLDAIYINPIPQRGPRTTYRQALFSGIIAASTDPVALDFWAAKYILIPAARKGGHSRIDAMDPEGYDPGTFGYWLSLSAKEIRQAGFTANMEEEKIRIYVRSRL